MKKLFISMCVALVGLCASAQEKGDMTVGLNLGVAPCLESGANVTNFGIGAKFQYNVTNPIRLEADVDYWFKNKGMDVFDVTANVHYLFNVGSKLKVYPLIGIGYARLGGSLELTTLIMRIITMRPLSANFGSADFSGWRKGCQEYSVIFAQ